MALATSALIGGALSLGGAAMQASAANKASDAQTKAAQDQLALQRDMYNTTRQDLSQFRDSGGNALAAYMSELGLGERPEGYAGISMSPGAQFALGQGVDSIQSSAAARGGLRSGNALQSLEQFRFGLAAGDRDNQLNRLAGLSDMGMGAAGMNANNANAFANMGSNAYANMGNAAASGIIGQGNAFAGGLGNLANVFGYMKS